MTNFIHQAATELQINAETQARLAREARDNNTNSYLGVDDHIRSIIAKDWQRDAARTSNIARGLMGLEA